MFPVTMSQTLQAGKLENKMYLLEIRQKLYSPSPPPPPHSYLLKYLIKVKRTINNFQRHFRKCLPSRYP